MTPRAGSVLKLVCALSRIQWRAVRPIGNPIAIGIAVGAPEPGSRIADARGLNAREGALGTVAVDPPCNVHDGVGGGAGKEADLARGPVVIKKILTHLKEKAAPEPAGLFD